MAERSRRAGWRALRDRVHPRGPLFNVPLSYRRQPREDLSYGFVGAAGLDGEVFYVYDALHDPEARAASCCAVSSTGADAARPTSSTTRLRGLLARGRRATACCSSAEQSNTSVIVGDCLVKFFRKLAPGRNPDIEIQAALTLARLRARSRRCSAGSAAATSISRWSASSSGRRPTAGTRRRASVRALQDDAVRARDAGGDFARRASGWAQTLALVHEQMRQTSADGSSGARGASPRWWRA